jgi:DMSO/TMAO reductase YedYZ molybdopterin-dependent catalytic subunit
LSNSSNSRRRHFGVQAGAVFPPQAALHPQTQLTLKFDHKTLPVAYGFPIKIRIPTKLGFKNPKYVTAMWVQNNDAGGYWENQGYNWFSGL